jgi:dienelactone hydrolase
MESAYRNAKDDRMLLEESAIRYVDGDITCRGLLVHDPSPGSQPGIVLFPDARGLGDTAKGYARRLADCGFVVLIADLYGQGFTADIPRAHELMTALRSDVERWRRRGRAALEALAGQPSVDATRLAAIGYCFGGTTALELGRSGAELAAIVSFHGGLASPRPQDAAYFKARVLACHGGADPVVPCPGDGVREPRDPRHCRLDARSLCRRAAQLHSHRACGSGSSRSRLRCPRRRAIVAGND